MKKLILFFLLAPIMVFANDYSPFKSVEESREKISLIFKDQGIKFKVTFRGQSFTNRYGQELKIKKGEKLVLIEKHTKYIVIATTNSNLHVQSIHNWQGKITKKSYNIEFSRKEQLYVSTLEFSAWLQTQEFKAIISSIPSQQYPIIIEAKALLGDGVVLRVLFNNKPTNFLKYEFVFNTDKEEFIRKNKEFKKLGYMLIHHQVIQLMHGKSHQAVWVLNNKTNKT